MPDQKNKCYAIIPAAGRSHRMGTPKLLLPWPTERRPNGILIEHVLDVWTESNVDQTVIVLRNDDNTNLASFCSRFSVSIVIADNPADMKASIQHGLKLLIADFKPTDADRFFIAPADLPAVSVSIIDRLLAAEAPHNNIIVPKFGSKTGHPVLLPWSKANSIFELSENVGVNKIVDCSEKTEIDFPAEELAKDIDTIEDYHEALRQLKTDRN